MAKLRLNFLDNPHLVDRPNLVSILEKFGKEIQDYANDYFNYVVTSSSNEGVLLDFNLYLLAPEIGYNYNVIKVEILDISTVRIIFFTLVTKQMEKVEVDISKGTKEYESKLAEFLSGGLFNASLQFLVQQIELKKSLRS